MTALILTNVQIFDGSGAPRFPGEVRIEGDRIAAIGRGTAELGRADARVIDGGGATLIPGLIDAHAHLSFGSTVEQINPPGHRSDQEMALLIAHCGRVLLDHGFTGAYSGGSASPRAEVAAALAFDRGWIPGPRLRTSSFERTPGGEMGMATRFAAADSRPADPRQTAAFVAEMADIGVDAVKFLLTGVSAFDPGANLVEQFHPQEIAAAAQMARERGVWLTAHAYTPDTISLAIENGFRILYHCSWADERSLDLIEAHKDDLFIAPSPGIAEADLLRAPRFGVMASPGQREEQAEAVERLKWIGTELRRRGVRSLPGGDYGFPWNPVGRNARDLELFVSWFGYTPAEALHAATGLGGALMALDTPVGLVAEGHLADLLMVSGDPTADIALLTDPGNILAIMKGGTFHKAPVL
jgi:imidazolonepropionase-like amidohydrolase